MINSVTASPPLRDHALRSAKGIESPSEITYLPDMPEISRFLGIIIRMYYRDHAPPHFHAEYGEYEITVEIATGIVTGHFPR